MLVCRLFARIQRMRRHCLNEPAVLYALEPDQAVGKLLDLSRLAVHDQHLKTRFVIEVRVTGRNNQVMKKMLKIRELLAYAMLMVIVYKRNCSDYRRIWRGRLLAYEAITNEVTECLGAIRVTAFLYG